MAKRVILWTAPRCLSNAFLCSVSSLNNTRHFHELFSGAYYFVAIGNQFSHANKHIPEDDLTYDGVKNILLNDYPGMDLVFSKEFAFCLPEAMYDEITNGSKFAEFTHSFLIRDPEHAICSYYKSIQSEGDNSFMDLSEIKIFYPKMYKLYNFIKEKKGLNPVVVDATDLQTHPEETMRSYCDATGIQFDPKMMSWEPGQFVPRYKFWASKDWHTTVLQSTSFHKPMPVGQKPVPVNDLPKEVQQYIEESHFYYEEMKKVCLKPK